jgi:hypothetical protein
MVDVYKFFDFLKDIKPIPLSVKVKLDVPITEEDLNRHVTLTIHRGDEWGTKIPEGLHFKAGLDVTNWGTSENFYLPVDTIIDGDFELHGDFLGSLDDVTINKGTKYQHRISFYECGNIATIPSYNLEDATVSITRCENFTHTPNNLNIQFLYLQHLPNLSELGSIKTKMSLNIRDCSRLHFIAPSTTVEFNCVLENLPNLTELPYNLTVNRMLTIKNCGIQKKYSVEELQERLPFVRTINYE